MLRLQQRLQQRYPDWFRGRRAHVVRPLLRGVARWSRLDVLDAFLAQNGHLRGFAFLDAALRHVQLKYSVDDAGGQRRIPAQGRLLIIANHPSGALDALALLDLVGQVRRDVRIVANDVLTLIEPLSDLLLPLRILGGSARAGSLRCIERALENEECVIVFPAGEVSRLGPRGVRDTRWRRGFLRFARKTGAPVLPIRIEARNSSLFYGVSALYRPASTALLAREMYTRCHRPLLLRIGQCQTVSANGDSKTALRDVRRALYAIGKRGGAATVAPTPGPEPIADAIDPKTVWMAVQATELLGETSDGKQIRLAPGAQDSVLLQEIGRLRELTFRQVGEGTGRCRDLDVFDAHYQHIVLWDAAAMRIAGAYRVARGAPALARAGLSGLYTATLFRYADDAIAHLAEGMELGRSFVAPEYWGGRSLDYLWQGIGAYLRRYPRVRYLFGAVSISAALPRSAREQLVGYYQQYYGSAEPLAASMQPFQYFAAPASFGELDAQTAFGVLKANLSALGATVPTLYKQYTELCEPGGARFLAFGVDPAFSDSIDGLIEIDLHCVQPKKRQRYLQRSEAMPG